MTTTFNEQSFEQKLVALKDTQEAINALSQWCLQNKEHHKKIVLCWLHCLKRVKIEVRLSFFYLANDVIQYSKRKHLDFVDSWATALQKATTLVRDDKIRPKIERIFKIWEERGVYDEAFISDLCGLLTTKVKKKSVAECENSTEQTDFQPTALIRKIKEIKVLGENTDIKYKRIKDNKLPLTDAETMRLSLKDRRHGSDVAAEVDNGVKKMEAFVKALESEISSREKLLDLLRQATVFYENQRGEAKIVANAYRNFGNRLKSRLKALQDVINDMNSPVPSPDVNAPSPSPDSDLEARANRTSIAASAVAEMQHSYAAQMEPPPNGDLQFNLVNSSFIGSAEFFGITKDAFSLEPPPPPPQHPEHVNREAQAIEVIGTREVAGGAGFDVAEFFKSLMPNKELPLQPPPMPPMEVPPVFSEWSASGPWDQPPPDTPQSPPQYEKQVSHAHPPVEYDDSMPVPPVPDMDHRMLLPPPELPQMDVDHRGPPPSMVSIPPPPLPADMDHRAVMPPIVSDRGALIATPAGMMGPPLPPPAVQALLDVDQRNLISLTGSPGSQGQIHEQQSYGHENTSYPPPHNSFSKEDTSYPPPNYQEEESNYQQPVFPPQESSYPKQQQQIEVQEYVPTQRGQLGYDEDEYVPEEEYTPLSQDVYEPEPDIGEFLPQPEWNRGPNLRDVDPRIKDNVESIDMDCSDDDEESQRGISKGVEAGSASHAFARNHSDDQIPPPNQLQHRRPPVSPFQRGVQPQNMPSAQKNPLQERLMAMSSAGAKLIPPEQAPAEENGDYEEDYSEDYHEERDEFQEGYQEEFYPEAEVLPPPPPVPRPHMMPRPRWRGPRPGGFGGPRPRFPYRGRPHPRFFQPRCPW